MTIKKPIRRQEKNSDSLEESNGFTPPKEKDVEAIHNSKFEEGAYFEAVVDMEEWF